MNHALTCFWIGYVVCGLSFGLLLWGGEETLTHFRQREPGLSRVSIRLWYWFGVILIWPLAAAIAGHSVYTAWRAARRFKRGGR